VETSRRLSLTPLRRCLLRERRVLGRRQLLSLLKELRVLDIKRRIKQKILPEEEVAEEEEEEGILEARVVDSSKEKSLILIAYDSIKMDMMHPHVSFIGTELSRKEMKAKVKPMKKGNVKHPNLVTMLWHIVVLE